MTLEEKKQFLIDNLHKQCIFRDEHSEIWHGPFVLCGISSDGGFFDEDGNLWDKCKLYEQPKARESLVKQFSAIYGTKGANMFKQMAKELDALAEKSDD